MGGFFVRIFFVRIFWEDFLGGILWEVVEAAAFLPDITNILTTNGDGQIKV